MGVGSLEGSQREREKRRESMDVRWKEKEQRDARRERFSKLADSFIFEDESYS